MMTGILQLTPVALMVSVIAMNHLITISEQTKNFQSRLPGSDQRCLPSYVLCWRIYEKNLELIERKADYILSTRSSVVIYRGNLGRLTTLLDASVIEQIVGIFAQNERIEAVVAATQISNATSPTSFRQQMRTTMNGRVCSSRQ